MQKSCQVCQSLVHQGFDGVRVGSGAGQKGLDIGQKGLDIGQKGLDIRKTTLSSA